MLWRVIEVTANQVQTRVVFDTYGGMDPAGNPDPLGTRYVHQYYRTSRLIHGPVPAPFRVGQMFDPSSD